MAVREINDQLMQLDRAFIDPAGLPGRPLKRQVYPFSQNVFYHFKDKDHLWTLSQTTNYRLIQIERVCRRQFQIRWKWQKFLQTRRKHVERRNCSLRAIASFPTVFSKNCIADTWKPGLVWEGLITFDLLPLKGIVLVESTVLSSVNPFPNDKI